MTPLFYFYTSQKIKTRICKGGEENEKECFSDDWFFDVIYELLL